MVIAATTIIMKERTVKILMFFIMIMVIMRTTYGILMLIKIRKMKILTITKE